MGGAGAGRGSGAASDGQAEGADDAVHGLVLPPHCAAPVRGAVPEAGAGRVQPRPILLHDDAGHDVLEGLAQLGELAQRLLHHARGPLVHLAVLVGIAANGALYGLGNRRRSAGQQQVEASDARNIPARAQPHQTVSLSPFPMHFKASSYSASKLKTSDQIQHKV